MATEASSVTDAAVDLEDDMNHDENVRAKRRVLTDAMHAMHVDQRIKIDIELATALGQAWHDYDEAIAHTMGAEVECLKAQVAAVQRDLEHTNAERLRLRLVLVQIQDWDCLNPPDPRLCADHPWLRRLVDNSLGAAQTVTQLQADMEAKA